MVIAHVFLPVENSLQPFIPMVLTTFLSSAAVGRGWVLGSMSRLSSIIPKTSIGIGAKLTFSSIRVSSNDVSENNSQ